MRTFVKNSLIISLLFGSALAVAEEEEIQLDKLTEPAASSLRPNATLSSQFHLMGRIDLTYQSSAVDKGKERSGQMDNQHFLIFLKMQASPKVGFFGEIIDQAFYFVSYQAQENVEWQFGKILVPFGDTQRFHHLYGGVTQLKSQGVMLPNVWAESGLNLQWSVAPDSKLDLYFVDSLQDDSLTEDPDLKNSQESGEIQAGGLRWTQTLAKAKVIVSGYRGEYQSGREVWLGGFDLLSERNLFGVKGLRLSFGLANAWIKKAPVSGDFQKRGDYLEVSHLGTWSEEHDLRFRYGTYIDNDEVSSQKDTHSFSLGYALPIDIMKCLFEYQWNFEAKDEVNNDLAKIMLSVDF